MADAMMAYPELRNPFSQQPIHPSGASTVLYDGRSITLNETADDERLLIKAEDLKTINGFELKPEGACYEDLCIPAHNGLLVEQAGREWFDLCALADILGQVYVADLENRVWSFGEIPAKRDNMLLNAMAPPLEVTDRKGNVIRLADLKGKKALIVTWSSW